MQVDGLTKSFGDLVLFRKISFGVAEGQRIGLIRRDMMKEASSFVVICGWAIWSKTHIIPKT